MVGTLFWFGVLAALPAPKPAETLIRLTVDPMPAPKPALRYLLLPELKEMSPGNPIPNYLKGLLDQDFSAEQETLTPAALRQADRAARMDKPDWQILLRLKTDGISLLLPDLQKMRSLAAGLQARFREEIAQGRFDDAITTAKTMLAMSRHMGEHPTLIGDLVGIAIAMIALGPLEEMLEQPGCPNLYWALTNLPRPLVPMDRGIEGERALILAEMPGLEDTAPLTAAQLKKLIAHVEGLWASDDIRALPGRSVRAYINERTRDEKYMAAARRRLVGYGIPEDRLAKYPPEQVVLVDEKRTYEVLRDEEMKYMNLPTWEALAGISYPQKKPENAGLFTIFVPSVYKIRQAQGRLEQKIALLRHVEAVRLYAAEHGGKLPERLSDVTVPLPPDPFTGKPFRYAVEGSVAHLRGNPPRGGENVPVYNLHYEITIRK